MIWFVEIQESTHLTSCLNAPTHHLVSQRGWRQSSKSVVLIFKDYKPNVLQFVPSKAQGAVWLNFWVSRITFVVRYRWLNNSSKMLAMSASFYQSFIVNSTLLRWYVSMDYTCYILAKLCISSIGAGVSITIDNFKSRILLLPRKQLLKS